MAIAAKFGGFCGSCREQYPAGTMIEKAGGKWGHATCPGKGSRVAPRTTSPRRARPSVPRRSSFPWETPPEPGAHLISRRAARGEGYAVGQVLHATKVQVPGGGPDGHYYDQPPSGRMRTGRECSSCWVQPTGRLDDRTSSRSTPAAKSPAKAHLQRSG